LTLTVAAQSLQAVAGRHAQVFELPSGVNSQKLGAGAALNLHGEPAHRVACKDCSRYRSAETVK
jgi:hypothetical protein